MEDLKKYIRSVPDFPKPGIKFYDITTLLIDPAGFKKALDEMEKFVRPLGVTKIISIESRGFVFGAALADRLGIGLVTARKPGKLPYKTISFTYELEYGTDTLEVHADAIRPGSNVLVVDDLLATGGTVEACCRMVENAGAKVAGCAFLIELVGLGGVKRISGYKTVSLIKYD